MSAQQLARLAALLALSHPAAALRPPQPVIVGSSPCSSYAFGKLQRAAQIVGAGLGKPKAVGNDEGRLQKVLWSQFGMANALASDLMERQQLGRLRSITGTEVSTELGALMFLDLLPAEAPRSFFNPFAKKEAAPPAPPSLDVDALTIAAEAKMMHVYIALADATALEQCVTCLRSLPSLRATLVVPEVGVTVATTPGWASMLPQDLEGELVSTLQIRNGLEALSEAEEGGEGGIEVEPLPSLLPERPPVAGSIATEDFAEVMVQCALRLDRSKTDGAQRLRVLRLSPLNDASVGGLLRPDARVKIGGLVEASELNGQGGTLMRAEDNMDGSVTISGDKGWIVRTDPKPRTPLGKMKRIREVNLEAQAPSAEWTELLAPFGRVRARDPKDPRELRPEWGPFGARAASDMSDPFFGT